MIFFTPDIFQDCPTGKNEEMKSRISFLTSHPSESAAALDG